MKLKKKNLLLFTICGFLVIITACSSSTASEGNDMNKNETIKLSYAFFAPDNTFPAVQMKKWAEELTDRTDGKVEVEMFFGGTILDASNMFEGVANGTADIGLTSTTYEPGRFPLLEISDLPSGYPNAEVASQVVYDLIMEYPPEALEEFKVITAFATEPSYIQSKDRISNLDELSGKQLRISGALTRLFEKLGAAPVGMAQVEVPEALQTGIIDGNISSREVLKDLKLAENAKYVTDIPLTVTSFVAVMNKEKWESLPNDVKETIDELSREMSIFTGKYLDDYVQETIDWAKKEEGLEVVSLSKKEEQKWMSLIEDFQEEEVKEANELGLPGTEYQERLYELIDKYSN